MHIKRAFILVRSCIPLVLPFLLSGIDWSINNKKNNLVPIEAHLVVKKKDRNLLPKKPKAVMPIVKIANKNELKEKLGPGIVPRLDRGINRSLKQ